MDSEGLALQPDLTQFGTAVCRQFLQRQIVTVTFANFMQKYDSLASQFALTHVSPYVGELSENCLSRKE